MATPQSHCLFPAGSSLLPVGGPLARRIVYLSWHAPILRRELITRHLPVWGIFYSLVIWWPVWSVTEELTYHRYLASRFAALSRHRSVPYTLVGFWWAVQHSFLPFELDLRFLLYKFLLYWRTRRLVPLIVAHSMMDICAS